MLNEEIRRAHGKQNLLHTIALLGGLGLVVAVPVWLIWGAWGLLPAAVFMAAMYVAARQTPPELVMRAYRARHMPADGGSQLARIVSVLAERAGLAQSPALYLIPSLTLNAFAAGSQDRAVIGITEGLVRKLTMQELAAVLAHEISHVKNNDTKVMAIADIATRMVQAMSYLAVFLLAANLMSMMVDGEPSVSWLAIVILYAAPLLSSLLQLGLSRAREYDADLEAAQLTGNPAWLASALQRLEYHSGSFWEDLMMPVPGRRVPDPSLLRSHPTTEERVARLRALDVRANVPPILIRDEPFVSMVDAGLIQMRPRYRFPGIWY